MSSRLAAIRRFWFSRLCLWYLWRYLLILLVFRILMLSTTRLDTVLDRHFGGTDLAASNERPAKRAQVTRSLQGDAILILTITVAYWLYALRRAPLRLILGNLSVGAGQLLVLLLIAGAAEVILMRGVWH